MFTFGISQSCVWGFTAVATPIGISGQTTVTSADERFPVGVDVDGVRRPLAIQHVLDPDDLVKFRLRDVDGLPLLQLVAVRAVGQVEAVGDPTWTERKLGKMLITF